jgi:NAD(P)H dehydrogenase (quinone)
VKHAVIFAHPCQQSFTASVAKAYAKACEALGHGVVQRDLYGIEFDPRLRLEEIPTNPAFQPGPDVMAEREMLKSCDVFALVYPLWLNSPPAILKGYLERVFGFGFAYGGDGHSYNPLLKGRKLISFSSSGAPTDWLKQKGSFGAMQNLFDDYFAELCGLASLQHVHFGSMRAGASEAFVSARLREATDAVTAHFGRQECH